MGVLVSKNLIVKLLDGIKNHNDNDEINRECLDKISDLLKRFGHLIASEHENIMNLVVLQLENNKPVIKKRAAICLGSLAAVSTDVLLNRLVEVILNKIDLSVENKSGKQQSMNTRTLLQAIGTISRTVGYRLGRHLNRLIPLFLKFCGNPDDEDQQTDEANELREYCFPGLESFVLKCPREVTPFIDDILQVSVEFMKYDPNYTEDESDDEDANMDADNDEDEEDYYEEDYGGSDDDDTSWKVRKSAVQVLNAIITSRSETIDSKYINEILYRVREREENVRLDIISCFTNFLSKSTSKISNNTSEITSVEQIQISDTVDFINNLKPSIIKATVRHLKTSSIATKSALFAMLRTLVIVTKGGLEEYLPELLSYVEKCFADKNQSLKLDVLIFLRLSFELHSPSALQACIPALLPLVINAVNEDWYKIIAEALRVLGSFITVIRPIDPVSGLFDGEYEGFSSIVVPIYNSLLPRLKQLDIDLEILESSITTTGILFSILGDKLTNELPGVLELLHDRMENEVTRTSTLKTFSAIASSSLDLDLSPIINNSTIQISHYLRQQSRQLKQATLQTLESLILSNSSSHLTVEQLNEVLTEVAANISDSDLHLTSLSLNVSQCIFNKFQTQEITNQIRKEIYPRIINLATSSLLQGTTQTILISFLQDISNSNFLNNKIGISYDEILQSLYACSLNCKLVKQSMSNLSKCMAGLCACVQDSNIRDKTVELFANDINSSYDTKKLLALLCIGELGQQTDLSVAAANFNLKDLILACFESVSEETKLAAAYALGNLAVGNMEVFLPVVLQGVESNKHQYLLLASLKEIISVHVNNEINFEFYLDRVLPGLLKQCKVDEEGVRNMVAECIGNLTSVYATNITPILKQLIDDNRGDRLTRWTLSTSLRFSLSRKAPFDSIYPLTVAIESFLPLLIDEDIEVRKATILMVNACIHHNPRIVEPFIESSISPHLFTTLNFFNERVVDLGPFKHKVDDGIPLRKVALTCIESILDVLPSKLDICAFLNRITGADNKDEKKPKLLLTDLGDIKIQTHQVILIIFN
jgi:cullin-associated NEDD8-dissociated protein 1